jgi:quercetin dioxygenase-like cupin family protein
MHPIDDRIQPAPDPLNDEPSSLLQGPLADAWPESPAPSGLRQRLAARASRSAQATAALVNVRRNTRALLERTPQRIVHELYRRPDVASPSRPGEPTHVRLIELMPQGAWLLPTGDAATGREWMLIRGTAHLQVEGEPILPLRPLDYHVQSAAASCAPACIFAAEDGALVLLRERALGLEEIGGAVSSTTREAPAQWVDYAPLIKRRLLWQQGSLAAMLWLAEPGASVPHHTHGHDEECLMLRGELFQDDYLLREGDYQLAPGGSAHRAVTTDTGALIYAHGDLEMKFVGPAGDL